MRLPFRPLLVAGVALASLAACSTDLAITNTNNADITRALARPSDLENLLAGGFNQVVQNTTGGANDNINNSLLPEVIDSRLGMPITLSLVYIFVGHRCGLEFSGVGLPGHFLIRHREHFFDPFHGGRRIGLAECRALVEQQSLELTASHLEATTERQMLIRTLTNIHALAAERDPELGSKVRMWAGILHAHGR